MLRVAVVLVALGLYGFSALAQPAGPQARAEKDLPNGYAGLDSSGYLKASEITAALLNAVYGYTPARSGANSDITSLTGLSTPLSILQGGTGSATPFGTASGTFAQGNDSRIVGAEQTANKNVANGYAGLDSGGHVASGQLSASILSALLAGQDISGATATITGSGLVPLSLAVRFGEAIDCIDDGVVGDDIVDDTAALNHCFDRARAAFASASIGGVLITLPARQYRTTSPLNFTGFNAYPTTRLVVLNAWGAIIDGQFASASTADNIFDMMGDREVVINGLSIQGTGVGGVPPNSGIAHGRLADPPSTPAGLSQADALTFNDVSIQGIFASAALYNFASEDTSYHHLRAANAYGNANAHSAIFDGINQFGITSHFQTETATADTAVPFDQDTCLQCEFRNSGTGAGATVVISNPYSIKFIGGYNLNLAGSYNVQFDTTAGAIYQAIFDTHFEAATGSNFLIRSDNADNPIIYDLKYHDTFNFATTSIFRNGLSTASVTFQNLDVSVDDFISGTTPQLVLPGTASIWKVAGGTVSLPNVGNWLFPPGAGFTGTLCLGGVCRVSVANSEFDGYQINGTTVLWLPNTNSIGLGGNNQRNGTTGDFNTWLSPNAGALINTGQLDTGAGFSALGALTTGSVDSGFGWHACNLAIDSNNLTCLGAATGASVRHATNVTLAGEGVDDPGDTSNYANWVNVFVSTALNFTPATSMKGSLALASHVPITPASGDVVAMASNVPSEEISGAGPLATLTVRLPPGPIDGQQAAVLFDVAVTALTVTDALAGTSDLVNCTFNPGAGQRLGALWNAGDSKWHCWH